MRRGRETDEPEIELIVEPLGSTAAPPVERSSVVREPMEPLVRLAAIAVVVVSLCFVVMAWSLLASARAQQRQACIAGATASVQTFYFGNNTDTEARRAQAFVTEQMRHCGVPIIDINATTTTR